MTNPPETKVINPVKNKIKIKTLPGGDGKVAAIHSSSSFSMNANTKSEGEVQKVQKTTQM